jgi:hypothetical protein
MTKISDLDKISGDKTKSRDLFVVVNLDQGDDGTKSITRAELINALEEEVFDNIKIEGGYIKDVPITDPNISVTETFSDDIAPTDYFYLKDVSSGTTVAFSYSQLYNEIAKSSKKAKKIYVSVEGNDNDVGSYLAPVATLERAVRIAQEAAKEVTPGLLGRQIVNITVHPGTYYTNGELELPDFCSIVSSTGQYTTNIVMNPGYESKNCILLGSGCYAQGFSFFNLKVDNFDYPTSGFAYAFRPGARITRSPYIRDSSQISNYFEREIPPLLNPFNSRGTIEDLGVELTVSSVSSNTDFQVGDSIETSDGVTGFISRVEEITSGTIYVRNSSADFAANTTITTSSGGTATITVVGEEDFPNKNVGRGGGMILADRALVDQDSIFPYILCFGATPRTQNGLGYVAKNGAGINGISSLSIFSRCAFYALDGGQITLNNSGTQFGDISMRAKGTTPVFNPRETSVARVVNVDLADTIINSSNTVIDDLWDHLTGTLGFEGYDSEKCKRDTRYILEGVGNDLVLGTNYWAVVNGISYRRASSSVVINSQLTETSGAISFLKSSVQNLLEDAASTSRTDASFDEIIDILTNGTGNADALTFTNTGVTNHAIARDLLVDNKSIIQTDLISWINTNYPSLVYNQADFTADFGYTIDALTHDINYNTNIATILNTESYFEDVTTPASATGTVSNPTSVNATVEINNTTIDIIGADLNAVVANLNIRFTRERGRGSSFDGMVASNAGGFLKIEKSIGSFTVSEATVNSAPWVTQIGIAYGTYSASSTRLTSTQNEPTSAAYKRLGEICAQVVLGTYPGQSTAPGIASQNEANRCVELTNITRNSIKNGSLTYLPAAQEPDLSWVNTTFVNNREIINDNIANLQRTTIAYVNSEYDFIDETLTRRDALNFLRSITNDFREGTQTGTRIFTSGLFNYRGKHVFSVFNPTTVGLNYVGSVAGPGTANLPAGATVEINDAYIVYSSVANVYDGTIYYWDGSAWTSDGANDITLLNAFTDSWDRMRNTIKADFSLTAGEEAMLDGLIDDVLIASVRNPRIINFGSLVESLSHQFNLASAGVNVNALPLNFRRLGQPISAAASVLQEDGGRVRWSGADELNNQYFARGLRINGRTGRIEGRPFTSSVRKLARRAANSRTST